MIDKDTLFVLWFVAAFIGFTALGFLFDARTKRQAAILSAISGTCLTIVATLPI